MSQRKTSQIETMWRHITQRECCLHFKKHLITSFKSSVTITLIFAKKFFAY